ncbi:MAG TPA: hypothetical protein PLD62_06115 [Candidatus Cloacimonadota bacterium]|nr:hypothetical protein [Candidatus Cloacimonadota bacterium]
MFLFAADLHRLNTDFLPQRHKGHYESLILIRQLPDYRGCSYEESLHLIFSSSHPPIFPSSHPLILSPSPPLKVSLLISAFRHRLHRNGL